MAEKADIPWEGRCLEAASAFGAHCVELRATNPYGRPVLSVIANDLLTVLWDRTFSQTEIRTAFEKALADLQEYAAGEDRRGDKR